MVPNRATNEILFKNQNKNLAIAMGAEVPAFLPATRCTARLYDRVPRRSNVKFSSQRLFGALQGNPPQPGLFQGDPLFPWSMTLMRGTANIL